MSKARDLLKIIEEEVKSVTATISVSFSFDIDSYIKHGSFVEQKTVERIPEVRYLVTNPWEITSRVTEFLNSMIEKKRGKK
jgi:hypothetical protein